jgi:hypothetical protein
VAVDATPAAGATRLGSSITTATQLLNVDPANIVGELENIELRSTDDWEPADKFFDKKIIASGKQGGLIVVLSLSTGGAGAEMENEPGDDEYYFIALTMNGLWHQPVLHAIGRSLGLGVEYDQAGSELLEPDTSEGQPIFELNLLYYASLPSGSPDNTFKWYPAMSALEQVASLTVHAHIGNSNDRDVRQAPFAQFINSVELYEGGGKFRTKVYRSAQYHFLVGPN